MVKMEGENSENGGGKGEEWTGERVRMEGGKGENGGSLNIFGDILWYNIVINIYIVIDYVILPNLMLIKNTT